MEIVSYLFGPFPGSAFGYYSHLMIFAAVLFVLGILIKIIVSRKNNKALRKVLRHTPGEFIWIAIILFILVSSRAKGVPYLSMRFMLFLILGLALYFIGKTIYNLIKKYPEMKKVVAPKTKNKEAPSYSTKK